MNLIEPAAAVALLLVMGATALNAQEPRIKRTDLVEAESQAAGKTILQARVDFDEGAFAARHRHPGEEVAHVLKGSLEYRVGGAAPVTLNAGQSLLIPAGVPHSARNVGKGEASELATYFVTKDAPLIEAVKD